MTGDDDADGPFHRAQLLAELGRYDEAVDELTPDGEPAPTTSTGEPVLTLLARLHLAAGRPAEALAAADSASAVNPGAVAPLVARALALVDLGRYAEAAATADRILAGGPADAYAQRAGAGILAEARNGQQALDAAWRAVELALDEPQAHLVLALVTARLQLFDLAERAYREALRLDPTLADAAGEPGVIRLERRRWAESLERVSELATVDPVRAEALPVEEGIRRLVLLGGAWTLVGSLLAAVAGGLSRFVAVLVAVVVGLALWRLAVRVPGLRDEVLPELRRTDRALALAIGAVVAGPLLILLHALVGSPWPLVAAIGVTTAAGLTLFTRMFR
ncbi:tetratricopeptide repeat protein [Micromonospora sp. KC723]|uniref:tetratricopeptide repeat protein n=1 Tax=Micromonospora sp. KC723 TaxID=2530381 RepID=UPI0010476BBA|nr:tetratricopeptide repeat protein [Micromonospora sp. KC723]TDB71299.1 tetratricopeptide repeat protein [Micromonospora sp. KC723]